MYFYMLAQQLDESSQTFLARSIFADQESFLSSVDLSNYPHLITKTDVAANDKEFLSRFTELLRETQNLKIDEQVLDNMIKSLYKAATNS